MSFRQIITEDSNYYVANASKQRNGNLNATFIMRMAEVYLIAAGADIYLNGGANAARFFHPNYALRPISTTFTATITNGSEYQNPGY